MDRAAMQKLPYKRIQSLAKRHGIRANDKKAKLIDNLLKKFYGRVSPTPDAAPIDVAKEVVQVPQDAEKEAEEQAGAAQEPEPGSQRRAVEQNTEEQEHLQIPSPRRMAALFSAVKPTMFPLPRSPVGRLRPANFDVMPPTDSPSSSSSHGSPARDLVIPSRPGPALLQYGRPTSHDFVPPAEWDPALCVPVGSASVLEARRPQRQQYEEDEAEKGNEDTEEAEENTEKEAEKNTKHDEHSGFGHHSVHAEQEDSGFGRPSAQELRFIFLQLESLASEKGQLRKEINDLGRAIKIVQTRERQNVEKLKKVQAMRKVIQQYYVGEENLAQLAAEGRDSRDGQGGRRLVGTRKRRVQGQGDESPSKRRRMMGA
ncbi:hypothetical protein C8T65DRAFT_698324 [Cerioporus squamosus]|nr:hypothetical protein C8T65DRAFT_698324 [Cerioporus squamosus]